MAESVHELMRELAALVYAHGDERTKARASICATYMRCIHDDYYTARDMLLMSHLQVQTLHVVCTTLHAAQSLHQTGARLIAAARRVHAHHRFA